MSRWKLIGRGRNGWHAQGVEGGNQVSSSGGTLENYLREAEDGVCIYDADEADPNAFSKWIICGPMANASLNSGEVKKFSDKAFLARMLPGLEGSFKAFGAMALLEGDSKIGSMDYVAIDLWLEMMKGKVPGVKFGRVSNHCAIWET